MNFWKQMTHVMSYFKEENFRGDKRLPSSFMEGFLEVRRTPAPLPPCVLFGLPRCTLALTWCCCRAGIRAGEVVVLRCVHITMEAVCSKKRKTMH